VITKYEIAALEKVRLFFYVFYMQNTVKTDCT